MPITRPGRLARLAGTVLAISIAAFAAFSPRGAAAACPDAIAGLAPRLIPASFQLAAAVPAVPPGQLRITFAGHASFLIESPAGIRVFTDYNGYVRYPRLPDIVTMNRFHESHYTDFPEPEIKHVLRGWRTEGGMARHNLRIKDLLVRSIPTNFGEEGDPGTNVNSIFIVESQRLCVAHLSHLHHILSKPQLAALGEIDVLFVPIDGMWTMSHAEVMKNLGLLRPKLVIPMHFGSYGSVTAFLALAEKIYPVKRHPENWILVARHRLPRKTEILFLEGDAGFY